MTTSSKPFAVAFLALLCATIPAQTAESKPAAGSKVHGFEMKRIDGTAEKLSTYQGKVVLIVNTASECGYTPQYAGLQRLQETYGSRGFTVLGFPCNDFGGQEPGTDADVQAFVQSEFKVTFPLFSKVVVKGEGACALYRYLQKESAKPSEVKWNFHKFLVDGDGTVLAAFGSKVTPEDPKITVAIEAALKPVAKGTESKPAAKPSGAGAGAIADAVEKAAREDKLVFVEFSADWCPYCRKLEAWMKLPKVKAVFDQDYVVVQVTTDHMTDGEAQLKRYAEGKETGIPFMAWVDGTGKVLDRSWTPKQENIGFPSTAEEIDAFMAIMKRRARHASAEAVESLRASLVEVNQPKK